MSVKVFTLNPKPDLEDLESEHYLTKDNNAENATPKDQRYCIGSEVGASFGYFRGELFKKFPLLWRRYLTSEERKLLIHKNIIDALSPPSMTLVKYEDYLNIKNDCGLIYKIQATDAKRSRSSTSIIPQVSAKKIKDSFNINQSTYVAPITPLKTMKSIEVVKQRTEDLFDHCDLNRLAKYKNLKPNLVPIKLDIEANSKRFRDIFLWDKSDETITPESFAFILCEDFELNNQQFYSPIVNSIKYQLDGHVNPKFFLNQASYQPDIITIKLDIPIGHTCLTDCFEWDANCRVESAPEEFAQKTCAELGLGGEFSVIIAYSIRTQVINHLKARYQEKSYIPSEPKKIYRSYQESDFYGPKIDVLSDEELQRKLSAAERNSRRSRRSTALNI